MRIGFLSNTYPPDANGVAFSLQKLSDELRAHGHDVAIAVPRQPGVSYPEYVHPLPSLPIPRFSRADIKIPFHYYAEAHRFFQEHKIELIHTHDTTFGGLAGSRLGRDLNIPSVHTYHTYIEQYSYVPVPAYTQIVRAFSRHVCNRYSTVIAPSTKIANYLRRIGIMAPIRTILNVPHVHVPTGFKRDKHLNTYGINDNDVVFVTFGRVAKEKNILAGIQTLEPLLKEGPAVKYIIAGPGPDLQRLKREVLMRNLQHKVIFTGAYTPETLPNLLRLADVYLFTSHTEVQPLTILEAMAHSLPVLAVDDEAVDYLLRDGHNGFKAPLNQLGKLAKQLSADKKLRHKLSVQAAKDAAALQHKPIIEEFISLYGSLISSHAKADQ